MSVTITQQNSKWKQVLNNLEKTIADRHVFDAFFIETKLLQVNDDELIIFSPTALTAQLLNKDTPYKKLINDIIKRIFLKEYKLTIVCDENYVKKQINDVVNDTSTNSSNHQYFANCKINHKYTFENFVVGDCNNEARRAALMVSTTPGSMFNPLFIYSKSGLGKTHLLHAIGNYYKEKNPSARVLYITTDAFIDEFVKYVHGSQDNQSLKDFFSTVDLLLVDDIQFLSDKTKTAEMFFYIFNALVNNGKQIVLTSDRHPKDLRGLEDRLVSRFNMGLSVQILNPDKDTLLNILKNKITSQGLDINNYDAAGLSFLAETFSKNVRELEGALNRLLFHTVSVNNEKVTLETIQEAVNFILPKGEKKKENITEDMIVNEVASYYNLSSDQIFSAVRTAQIALARRISMYLCRLLLGSSYPKIGEVFHRDHSTVITGVEKVEKELKTDNQLIQAINDLKKRLKK